MWPNSVAWPEHQQANMTFAISTNSRGQLQWQMSNGKHLYIWWQASSFYNSREFTDQLDNQQFFRKAVALPLCSGSHWRRYVSYIHLQIYNDSVSSTHYTLWMAGRLMNDILETIWNGRKWSCSLSRLCPSIHLKGLRKSSKSLVMI